MARKRTMPDKFHQSQYYVAGALMAITLILYTFAPESKAAVLAGFGGIFGGFITGKFSNGFSKSSKLPEPEEGDDNA